MIIVSDAGRTTVLPLGQHAFRGPRFSPDGRRIAVGDEPGGDLLGDVYMFDRGTETFTRITREGTSVFPEWTVDGNALLYSALNAGGNRSMFRIPVDRSASPVLVVEPPAASAAFEAFMTRGDTVVFRTNLASTGRDIYMRLPDGKSVPWEAGPFDERSPTLSPDGRLVLYVSNESGRDQVYVRRLAVPGSVQVSVFEGAEPVWGPGGRDAFYWGRDTLFAVPIGGSPAPSLGTRRVVLTGSYEREAYHANYDVAPDGRSFVMIRRSNGANAAVLQVLLNWIPVPKAAGTR
jgi:Tol biopolymer transport system component